MPTRKGMSSLPSNESGAPSSRESGLRPVVRQLNFDRHAELDWEQAYEDHAEFVWRCLRRMGLSESDASDSLHEVYLVAHRRRADFDPERGNARSWLMGIAANRVRSERRRQRLVPVDCPELARRHAQTDVAVSQRSRGTSDGDAELSRRQLQQALVSALDDLDPERRLIFTMFEVEGLPCQQIADELSVPVGTIYSRLHKARALLQTALVAHRDNLPGLKESK